VFFAIDLHVGSARAAVGRIPKRKSKELGKKSLDMVVYRESKCAAPMLCAEAILRCCKDGGCGFGASRRLESCDVDVAHGPSGIRQVLAYPGMRLFQGTGLVSI
jgi:hypothetical protein